MNKLGFIQNSIISIIIPTYNRANLLAHTIDSIISQTYKNWECIIVDDGSTDDTFKIVLNYVEKDNRIKFYRRPANYSKGANSCRNYGYDKSSGQFIKWFDSDDIMLPNLLEAQIDKIYNSDLSVCEIFKYDFNKDIVLGKNKIFSSRLIEKYLTGDVMFYVCGPLWKKTFLEKQTELFDEAVSNLDDWDFNLRMLYQNPKINYIYEPLILYRIHENSLSQEIDKLKNEEIMSEINTRYKHVALLREKNDGLNELLNLYILERLKYILRIALIRKDENWNLYFRILLSHQFNLNLYFSLVKTSVLVSIYSLFGIGEKFLKKI